MPPYPELEIGLHRRDAASPGLYGVEFRFNQPGSESETRLAGGKQITARLDLEALEALDSQPEAYAQALTAGFFADPNLLAAFREAQTIAHTLGQPLRLRLLIGASAPDLHTLHWEALLDPTTHSPLSTNENLLFSRYLSSDSWLPAPSRTDSRLRALVVIANPAGLERYKSGGQPLAPVPVAEELARARQSLTGVERIELASGGQATSEKVAECLRAARAGEEIDLLYLVCHGAMVNGEPWLWLEDESGGLRREPGEALIARMEEVRQPPRLVVLLSCQSAAPVGSGGETSTRDGGALSALGPRLVSRRIPAVVAMQGNFSMQTAAAFMPIFFQELLKDGEIDRAMAVARSSVRHRFDAWMPVLFSRLRDNCLFTPEAAQEPPRQPFEPETIYIPAGPFQMGRQPGPGVPSWETPQHEVQLPAFRIGKYPVTNAEFAEFIRETGLQAPAELGWPGQSPHPQQMRLPAAGVTWYDAVAYCQWLSEKTGRSYSLPTEAQWEKAARGSDGRLYPWGAAWEPGRCNQGSPQLAPVDQFPPQGPNGGCDWVGNVRQWTASLWGEKRLAPQFGYPWQATETQRNDLKANSQVRRVVRGSAAQDEPEASRCTARLSYAPDQPGPPEKRHGFRVVQNLEG